MEINDASTLLARGWVEYDRWAKKWLVRRYPEMVHAHDEIVSNVMTGALANADHINGTDNDLRAYLSASLRNRAATAIRKHGRTRQIGSGNQSSESEENKPRLPTPVVPASQEEIYFLKQLIERLGRLPPDEWLVLRHTYDHANLSEMCARLPRVMKWMRALRHGSQIDVAQAMGDMRKYAK